MHVLQKESLYEYGKCDCSETCAHAHSRQAFQLTWPKRRMNRQIRNVWLRRWQRGRVWCGAAFRCERSYLITGGSKGIGKALARQLLLDDPCAGIVLTSRSISRAEDAVSELLQETNAASSRLVPVQCDSADAEDVAELPRVLEGSFGNDVQCEMWLLSSGTNAYLVDKLVHFTYQMLEDITRTNSLGTLLCAQAALKRLTHIPSGGRVVLFEGAGADQSATQQLAAYGFTKAGVRQLAASLNEEAKETDDSVTVHSLNPGLVATDLLASGEGKFGSIGSVLVNLAAETPQRSAEVLAPKLLRLASMSARSARSKKQISAFQPRRVISRALRRLVDKESSKDRIFSEEL